jgi:galactokinase
MDAARIVRAAEQVSTGAQVGLLDPAVILHGRERGWVFLDCRKEVATVQRFPRNPPRDEWFLVDSGVPRSLAGTPYNERVAECAAAAAALGAGSRLRDVTPEDYRRKRSSLEPTLVRRCEHYFSEIKRVKLARRAVGAGDMVAIGRLMDASGRSLTDQFDCGTEETRTLLDLLRAADGTLGASYAGAGWGGLLQVLARPGSGPSLETAVARYRDLHPRVGSLARVIQVRPGPGVHVG